MYSGILLILCWTIVVVKSYPSLLTYDYYSPYQHPNFGNVKEIEFQTGDYLINDYQHDGSSDPCFQNENGDVKCFFDSAKMLPGEPAATAEYLRELELDRNSVYEQNLRNLQDPEVMEVVPPAHPNYNVYLHDDSSKRYSTYIHGLVPEDPPIFINSAYSAENRLPYNRPARRAQSYDEFLAQLSHDAIMNNVLPTMPYVRTSNYVGHYPISVPVQAVFPHAVSGCGQPVLVGCSPVISQGYIAHVHNGYPYVKAPQIKPITTYNSYAAPSYKLVNDKVKIVKPAVAVRKQDLQKEVIKSVPVDIRHA